MSYFDTIRCSSCNGTINPEAMGGRMGWACTHCGATRSPKDLFGLKDAFLDPDDEQPNLSLEDLVGGWESTEPVEPEPNANALELMRRMKKR